MDRPRILILENSTDVTGALKSVVRSSLCLREHFEFIFLLPKGSRAIPYLRKSGFECHEMKMREIRRDLATFFLYVPQLLINVLAFARLLDRLRIEVINSNDIYNLLPAFYRLFGGKTNYICYVRFRPSRFPQFLVTVWTKLHYRFASAIIAVSKVVKSELPINEKVSVIYNELPEQTVDFTQTKSNTILYPANYINGKGHQYALESFAAVAEKYTDWTLRFVGSDMGLDKNRAFKRQLQEKAIALSIQDKVQWLGFSENILDEYQKSALVLNFSESESFSLTCLEAMYCGRPVIATRCGGPEEIIEDQIDGLLVPTFDAIAMTNALEFLMSEIGRRETFGRNAYAHVRDMFSHANTSLHLKEVYFAALKRI